MLIPMDGEENKAALKYSWFLSIGFSFACLSELHQHFIYSQRYWDINEWAEDLVPALSGLIIMGLINAFIFYGIYLLMAGGLPRTRE